MFPSNQFQRSFQTSQQSQSGLGRITEVNSLPSGRQRISREFSSSGYDHDPTRRFNPAPPQPHSFQSDGLRASSPCKRPSSSFPTMSMGMSNQAKEDKLAKPPPRSTSTGVFSSFGASLGGPQCLKKSPFGGARNINPNATSSGLFRPVAAAATASTSGIRMPGPSVFPATTTATAPAPKQDFSLNKNIIKDPCQDPEIPVNLAFSPPPKSYPEQRPSSTMTFYKGASEEGEVPLNLSRPTSVMSTYSERPSEFGSPFPMSPQIASKLYQVQGQGQNQHVVDSSSSLGLGPQQAFHSGGETLDMRKLSIEKRCDSAKSFNYDIKTETGLDLSSPRPLLSRLEQCAKPFDCFRNRADDLQSEKSSSPFVTPAMSPFPVSSVSRMASPFPSQNPHPRTGTGRQEVGYLLGEAVSKLQLNQKTDMKHIFGEKSDAKAFSSFRDLHKGQNKITKPTPVAQGNVNNLFGTYAQKAEKLREIESSPKQSTSTKAKAETQVGHTRGALFLDLSMKPPMPTSQQSLNRNEPSTSSVESLKMEVDAPPPIPNPPSCQTKAIKLEPGVVDHTPKGNHRDGIKSLIEHYQKEAPVSFKGLSSKTNEGGYSDILVDKLEENYMKYRRHVLKNDGIMMTPYKFLSMICDRMKVNIHSEIFRFCSSPKQIQYRTEMYVAGFCGVAHAQSLGLSKQLAAAHVLERMRIHFRSIKATSYALFPGSRYTKICGKLEQLCEAFDLGLVQYLVIDKRYGKYMWNEEMEPRWECSAVVQNQEARVRSDHMMYGKFLAAKNMYLNFVKPPSVPVVQIKDYFAIGAECPMLKEVHPSLLLYTPSKNKNAWKEANLITNTDPWLHDPTNESRYLIQTTPKGKKSPKLVEFRQILEDALEWIQYQNRRNHWHSMRLRNGGNRMDMDVEEGNDAGETFHDAEDDAMSKP